jgi:hypothetical protein
MLLWHFRYATIESSERAGFKEPLSNPFFDDMLIKVDVLLGSLSGASPRGTTCN